MKNLYQKIILNSLAWIITLIVLIPFIVILVNSLKTQAESYNMSLQLPKIPQFQNYIIAIERGHLIKTFLNSILYSSASSLLIIVFGSMGAFVFSRNPTRFNRFVYFFIILGISLPINYVALMKVLQVSMLNNTRLGIILLYTAVNVPISVFIIHSFVGTIPKEIDEAAIIDGCSPLKIFFYAIFPLFKPVIVTVGVLCFMACWNEFIYPLYYLNSSFKWPMSLAVYNFFGQYVREWNLVCADIVLTSLPVIIVYIIGQKYIVSGMTLGAVKS